jgi:predicted transcriptional regulator
MNKNNIHTDIFVNKEIGNFDFIREKISGDLSVLVFEGDIKLIMINLSGNTNNKLKSLLEVNDFYKNNTIKKIALYSGIIDQKIKYYCSTNSIDLLKTIKFLNGDSEISIKVHKNRLIDNNITKDKRRTKEEIVLNILETIRETDLNITNIVYRCNLNYKYCIDLVDSMIEKKIIGATEQDKAIRYKLTSYGIVYMHKLESIKDMDI